MMILHAWASVSEDGSMIEAGYDNFDVVGVAVGSVEGRLVQSPLFVWEGELTNLADFREVLCTENSHEENVVVCNWPIHCDEAMMRDQLECMVDRVKAEELRRYAEAQGMTVDELTDKLGSNS